MGKALKPKISSTDLTGAVKRRTAPPSGPVMGRITRDLYEGARGDINRDPHPDR